VARYAQLEKTIKGGGAAIAFILKARESTIVTRKEKLPFPKYSLRTAVPDTHTSIGANYRKFGAVREVALFFSYLPCAHTETSNVGQPSALASISRV
jgi:hypothetical protein